MHEEDIKVSGCSRPIMLIQTKVLQFREYLVANGYDVSRCVSYLSGNYSLS